MCVLFNSVFFIFRCKRMYMGSKTRLSNIKEYVRIFVRGWNAVRCDEEPTLGCVNCVCTVVSAAYSDSLLLDVEKLRNCKIV